MTLNDSSGTETSQAVARLPLRQLGFLVKTSNI